MVMKNLILLSVALLLQYFPYDGEIPENMLLHENEDPGFSIVYPDYWTIIEEPEEMIAIQDGSIDLINEDALTDGDLNGYRVMVHVDGSLDYTSNVVVIAYPHIEGSYAIYDTSESAVLAVKDSYEDHRASGTYFLEETYLGESHCYVYRRSVPLEDTRDEIRVTYYITASRRHAFMLVETVLMSDLDDVNRDHFNQVIQSFRITENETGMIDPGLDWGAYKPGEDVSGGDPDSDIGDVVYTEEFESNENNWPIGADSIIRDGVYRLEGTDYPFTITSSYLGQISFDFSYEGRMEYIEGDDSAAFGLVFGYRDKDNYYAFLVTGNGYYVLVEERDGEVYELTDWARSDLLTSASHDLMVQGNYQTVGNEGRTHRYELWLYIDEEVVERFRINDILRVSGGFGIFVSEGVSVECDWLETRNYMEGAIMTMDRYE